MATDADETAPAGPDLPDQGRIVVVAVLFEGALAPLAAVLGWLMGCSPLEGFSWDLRDAVLGVLAALPMYGLLLLGLRWPVGPMAPIKRFFDEVLKPLLLGRPATDLALISLAAGVGEEMLFRGLFQALLARWLGTWPGLAAASFVFGLLHPITKSYVVIAGLLGAYLGALWLATGNLLTAIIAHALYDYLALRVLLRERAAPGAPRVEESS